LVWKDRVIVHTGGRDSAICAYDLKTGTLVWRAGSGAAAYSSPTLQTIDGQEQVLSFIAAGIVSVDPANGKVLWTYPFKTAYDCNTASPIAIDGKIFCSAGENHGCVLLEITQQGKEFVVNESWQSVESKSVMRNEWQTSIALDGYLYGFDNVGSAGPVTHFSCINATTGEPVWKEVRFGKGNLTFADGKLWITTMQGELVLVNVNSQRYQEMGRVKLFGKTRQSLTIANGFGYIRDDQEIVCIDLRKPNQ
jgi:outer membrane protein assembly factor BamB